MAVRVLFVSKPIVPPWSDGSKCLVRDIATHLERAQATVLTTAEPLPAELAGRVRGQAVYRGAGGFAPALRDNARVAWHLLRSRDADLWHFVMAPNPRTCQVGRALQRMRGVPVVQTIASQPRSFADIRSLLFGDVIVAQSHWTQGEVLRAWPAGSPAPNLQVIPPPLASVPQVSAGSRALARSRLGIAEQVPLFVYPGDLEVSQGARTVASLVEPLLRAEPASVIVFACREKTAEAARHRAELERQLAGTSVRFLGLVPEFHALLAAANAILFPVDDLYGKVDLPIALLEAMALGVPVLALGQGPLLDLQGGAELIGSHDPGPWIAACLRLIRDAGFARELAERGRSLVTTRHPAATIAAAYERIYEGLVAH